MTKPEGEVILIVYSIAVGLYAIYRTKFCVRGCDIARGEAEGCITAEDTKRGPYKPTAILYLLL